MKLISSGLFLSLSCVHRVTEAQSRPRQKYTPKPRPVYEYEAESSNGGYAPPAANPPSYAPGESHSATHVFYMSLCVCVCVCKALPSPPRRHVCKSEFPLKTAVCFPQLQLCTQPRPPSTERPSRAERVSQTDPENVSLPPR